MSLGRNSIICGGLAAGDSANNKIIIEGDNVSVGQIYGGQSHEGRAHNNAVNISGSDILAIDIYGGHTKAVSQAQENVVTISGTNVSTRNLYGGLAKGDAVNNTIAVEGDNASVERLIAVIVQLRVTLSRIV